MPMTREQAVKELSEMDGHEIIDGDYAIELAGAFGVSVKPYILRDDPHSFKGVHLDNGLKEIRGFGVMELAREICEGIGLSGTRYYNGRGSQFRAYVRRIIEGERKNERS